MLEAADGREALRILHGGPLPHLILFDLRMPVMNGWQFHDAIEAPDRPSAPGWPQAL